MIARRNNSSNRNEKGFTLLELVVGILVTSIALMVMTGALFTQAERSTNPWFQVRSAELAQSMMNEILARKYDENSYLIGNLRCGETGANNCTLLLECDEISTDPNAIYGPEAGENRSLFDDVDDFNCFQAAGNAINNIEDADIDDTYANFTINVAVSDAGLAFVQGKLITVTVTSPLGNDTVYSAVKVNY